MQVSLLRSSVHWRRGSERRGWGSRKKGERFGMLESCDHAFCLSCIRSWRKQREQQDRVNLRMCPVCRNESFFVIPCERLIVDLSEKALAIEDYKRQMAE